MTEALYAACGDSRSEPLMDWVADARARTIELVADLTDQQLRTKKLKIVNPLDWEIGHAAYFAELFVLRARQGRSPRLPEADSLFDSTAIEHDVRWDLPLPDRNGLYTYLHEVREDLLEFVASAKTSGLDPEAFYRCLLAVFHEDMHTEAFTYTRQTMGYPPPELENLAGTRAQGAGPVLGDAAVPGGRFRLGAELDAGFVLDNEAWAHEMTVEPFQIALTAVTQEEFAGFVEDCGYENGDYWSEDGWSWRESTGARAPLYWRRGARGIWERRDFDRWVPLEPRRAVIHVCWYEADAFARYQGRRLPTELEWEVAAAADPTADGRGLAPTKRVYPWGSDPPTPNRANLDWAAMGTLDVDALPDSVSAFGCRQMIGNVWEWTEDTFAPYPGFERGP
ncbi:MAG: SUMF1/EgtB/PvdO family nonheme iron enzyme [Gaiellaceae bacterium]